MKAIVHLTIEGTIKFEEENRDFSQQDYGESLKKHRVEKQLTLAQLSERSGVSPSHIARIEKGERSPNITIVNKLEKALGE